jgi:hypothetical protein
VVLERIFQQGPAHAGTVTKRPSRAALVPTTQRGVPAVDHQQEKIKRLIEERIRHSGRADLARWSV